MSISLRVRTAAGSADRERAPELVASNGNGRAPSIVSPEVWHAFERAIEQARIVFDGAADTEEMRQFLGSLERAVARIVAREGTDVEGVPMIASGVRALEYVRRAFVDELRANNARDAQHAIHVLSALGHVQCVLDRAATTAGAEQLIERAALGLTVEVAHDMRSPLAAILFLIDMLRTGRSGAVNELQSRQLGMIYGAALGLNQLACDVIDFVRGHDRLTEQQPTPFSVSEVLHSVHDIVRPIAEERSVAIQLITPEADARIGLPAALNRILLNLATNAIKFAKEGQVIVAAREITSKQIEFSVSDSGRGIPMEIMRQLFQPFRKPRYANSYAFSSTGLGLTICHKLANALGSELRVSTSPRRGTRFSFELELPIAGER